MKKYRRITDDRTLFLLDSGFNLADERSRECYRRLYEVENLIEAGELKFVAKKEAKKESGDEK